MLGTIVLVNKIKGANEKLMIGNFIVIVNEVTTLINIFLTKLIIVFFICIPLSIIRSFSFVLGPKSGGTEKGMTVPTQL